MARPSMSVSSFLLVVLATTALVWTPNCQAQDIPEGSGTEPTPALPPASATARAPTTAVPTTPMATAAPTVPVLSSVATTTTTMTTEAPEGKDDDSEGGISTTIVIVIVVCVLASILLGVLIAVIIVGMTRRTQGMYETCEAGDEQKAQKKAEVFL